MRSVAALTRCTSFAMNLHFRDEQPNPYDAPLIVATLVERPKAAKKRHPLLAAVFLICDVPFTLSTTGIALYLIGYSLGEADQSKFFTAIGTGAFLGWIAAFFWLVFVLCVKEIVQYSRGR